MTVCAEIRSRLVAAFAPDAVEVVDESESHRGHAGWREGGESHFRVTIRAPVFAAMGRVERHRAVHAALGRELVARLHALALDISG
ncbi:MAG: BolA family protein [Paracoccaceae bacterium]